MPDKDQQLHHCERCAAVFAAPQKVGLKVVCSECGESPVSTTHFITRAQAKTVVDRDAVHGVAGKDVADFLSIQKIKRQKQVRMAIVLWSVLLVALPVLIYYFEQQQTADSSKLAADNHAERMTLKELEEEAFDASFTTYKKYVEAQDENSKSEWIVGGVKQIVKLTADKERMLDVRPKMEEEFVDYKFFQNGAYPRVEGLLKSPKNTFEVVFWQVDGAWKLDWEHHVRYSDLIFKEFLKTQAIEESSEFRLLVRRRHSSSVKPGQDLQLLFYQPNAALGERGEESPQVELKSDNPLYTELTAQFERLAEKGEAVDGPGLLRIRAHLSFIQGKEGKPQLNLDKVSAYHWMAFDPEKAE